MTHAVESVGGRRKQHAEEYQARERAGADCGKYLEHVHASVVRFGLLRAELVPFDPMALFVVRRRTPQTSPIKKTDNVFVIGAVFSEVVPGSRDSNDYESEECNRK
eukprot:TRINITY_DN14132_c0_g1_i1.p3 TRINITY_DN14132_c0_g1~~TRINITY_DN14132_c0_g1_i1.p3  ORF type:complete len:106 (-),score=9.41 TRINITY_DN14132_c0_g1_i1:55-372(-)